MRGEREVDDSGHQNKTWFLVRGVTDLKPDQLEIYSELYNPQLKCVTKRDFVIYSVFKTVVTENLDIPNGILITVNYILHSKFSGDSLISGLSDNMQHILI